MRRAISFVGFRGVFTANMTGNTVLLDIAIASHFGYLPASLGIAVDRRGGFCRRSVITVPRYAFVDRDFVVLLSVGLVSLAMGAQSVAATKARVAGISTTYVTGTLVNAVMKTFSARPEGRQDSAKDAWAWITYLAGATGGAALLIGLHRAALFPIAFVFLGLAAWLAYESRSE